MCIFFSAIFNGNIIVKTLIEVVTIHHIFGSNNLQFGHLKIFDINVYIEREI